jgi:hypothetical protein
MRGFDQVSLKLKLDLELAVFMIGLSLRCGVQWPTCYFTGSWATIVSTYVGILVGMKWCISLTGINLPRYWLARDLWCLHKLVHWECENAKNNLKTCVKLI